MKERLEHVKIELAVLFSVQVAIALILEFVFRVRFAAWLLVFVAIDAIFVVWVMYLYREAEANQEYSIKQVVTDNVADAIAYGDVGLVAYDQNYVIVWMSDLFIQREVNYVGEKITMWIPEINLLFQDEVDQITVEFEGYRYQVQRRNEEQVLLFKDVTEISLLQGHYDDEKVVIGMIHMDNYNETVQYEDEQKIALINSNLRQRVLDWCKKYNMLVRRIRSDRFVVVLNEAIYQQAARDHFSILQEVRKEAANLEVAITLSMAFARGTSNYSELDKMVNDLLELAQNRGGDQVAARKVGEDIKFMGGSTEAQEKRSRVRVRVMAQTIRNMIESSSNVIIIGHKEMDFDCMGAAIGMSRIVSACGKDAYIVALDTTIEGKLKQCLYRFNDDLIAVHRFVNEDEALERMNASTLVIAVDHHAVGLSNAPRVLERSKKTMVIDHHRRKTDDNIQAVLVYVETSASSATELVTEFMQYQPERIEITETEANIMFAGMLVDTNHFRSRSGSRTFEAAAELRKMGADPLEADDLLKDTYKEFELRTRILSYSERIFENFVIAPIETDEIFTRTMLSQAADYLLSIQNVLASFVIAKIDEETVAISARSSGEVNVQILMEKMNGGGHFTGAAMQRKGSTVEAVTDELVNVLADYIKEVASHESNTAE